MTTEHTFYICQEASQMGVYRMRRTAVMTAILVAALFVVSPKAFPLSFETVAPQSTTVVDTTKDYGGLFSYVPTGKWIKVHNKTFAAPICCGWFQNKYLDHPECGTTPMPRTESGWGFQGRTDFLAHSFGDGCTCDSFQDDYTWSDANNVSSWNANDTCRKLNNRQVMLIGDSTMGQTASILMNAVFPAGCQTNFFFERGDTLIDKPLGAMNRGAYWTQSLMNNTDIVIISAGAHIYNRSNFNSVVNEVIKDIKVVKKLYPNIQVVWKTQSPGGCTDAPTEEIRLHNEHQYNEFYERDLYALSIFPRHGIDVIDMRMLYFRSDAHPSSYNKGFKDCLHMCLPGPSDIIAPLFSELLDRLSK